MFGVKPEHLQNTIKLRNREIVVIRQIIFYFLRKYTKLSYREIGAIYKKDHATCIYAERVIKDLIQTDAKVRYYCDAIDPIAFELLFDKQELNVRYSMVEIYAMMHEVFTEYQINEFKKAYHERQNKQLSKERSKSS